MNQSLKKVFVEHPQLQWVGLIFLVGVLKTKLKLNFQCFFYKWIEYNDSIFLYATAWPTIVSFPGPLEISKVPWHPC